MIVLIMAGVYLCGYIDASDRPEDRNIGRLMSAIVICGFTVWIYGRIR